MIRTLPTQTTSTDTLLSFRYQDDGVATLPLTPLQKRFVRQVVEKLRSGQYPLESVPCAVCGGHDFEQLAAKDRYGIPLSTQICKNCGLVQTNPRMTQAAYNEFYNCEYRPLYEGELRANPKPLRLQYARGVALREYVARFLSHPPQETRILEVGCGAGGVLQAFHEVGFQVQGIDLGEEYVTYGREHLGLDLTVATIHEVDLKRRPHMVLYSHVIEHILDLESEFRQVHRLLSPDGLLVIETPGLYHIPVNYAHDCLRYLQNAHVYTFSLRTLCNVLEPLGFRLLSGTEQVRAVFVALPQGTSARPQSDYPQARDFLRETELQFLLEVGLQRLGTAPAEAVLHFSQVIESFPTAPLAYHLLALALEKAGRAREARRIRAAAARLPLVH